MRGIVIVLLVLLCSGCATYLERGKIVDGKRIPEEYIKLRGIGKGGFPEGHNLEGKPIVEIPQLPSIDYER